MKRYNYDIKLEDFGRRLDLTLKEYFKDLSRNYIISLIRLGKVKVNEKIIYLPSYRIKSYGVVELLVEESKEISEFNQNYPIGEGVLKGINFLSSGYHIGVNTVGQSLKNANRQLRSEPPNPQVSVSPWMNSSIGPDLLRRPLEVGDSCGKGGSPPSGNSI